MRNGLRQGSTTNGYVGVSGTQRKSRAGTGIVKGEDEDGTSHVGQIVVWW